MVGLALIGRNAKANALFAGDEVVLAQATDICGECCIGAGLSATAAHDCNELFDALVWFVLRVLSMR